jgi:hypothetical protein
MNLKTIMIMCEVEKTIVKQIYHDNDDADHHEVSGNLPLHFLLKYSFFPSNISVEADCFRYLLNLYPDAAGIKDDQDGSPYDWAILNHINVYFIRLLLNADRTIDLDRRGNLNYAARRDAMFLSFRTLSSNHEPSIWIKLRFKKLDLFKNIFSYI